MTHRLNSVSLAAMLAGALALTGLAGAAAHGQSIPAAESPAAAPAGKTANATTQKTLEVVDADRYLALVAGHHGKPLMVTFWATWCEPCRDEYPLLNELAKQYAAKGLKIVGVSMDDDGDLILMRRFIARNKPVFPNYRQRGGVNSAFTQVVSPGWTGAMPATFFYDRDGRQVNMVLGEGTRPRFEAAIQAILDPSGGTR
ncbi:MAG TPA: TlpA disulfide reductase family protein [Candidatus Acidoferrales bacterium]|nr:TlpA disulfide reductase family protein [Candidatus Acidoferrales bacterium]